MISRLPPAVVLLSGGLDSTTVLAMARQQGFAVHALTIRYGQRHAREVEAAARVAKALGATAHVVLDLDLAAFGGSALVGDGAVPKDRSESEMANGIPATYVPARNTVFLSLALAWAESLGASDIFIGVNAVDYSGYPDCRPEFVAAYQTMANLATRAGVERRRPIMIHTPLIELTKARIIARGMALGVDFSLTATCYDPEPDGTACGHCDACLLRLKGFRDAGVVDPLPYRSGLQGEAP